MYRLRLKRPSPSLGEPWGCPPFKSSTRLGELAALAVAASFREAHWDVLLHPTKNGGVGQGNAPFGHHPDQVTGAQLEGQVPPHAEHDDLPVKVPPLEKILRRRPFDHPGRYGGVSAFSSVCTRTLWRTSTVALWRFLVTRQRP
jgi:hypothetical protein